MRSRIGLSILAAILLALSLVPVQQHSLLQDTIEISFADSEPELLVTAGTSQGHVNGSHIESVPTGWVISGDTRNSLQFGGMQVQATSVYNSQLDADTYIAALDETGNWLWATSPDASQGLTFVISMTTSVAGDIFIGGLIFDTVQFGQTTLNEQNGYGDGFVAKLDPMGNWMWATSFSTATNTGGNNSVVRGMSVNMAGDLIITGNQQGITNIGSFQFNNSDSEMFVAELDGNTGGVNWASTAGGLGDDEANDVGIDSTGIIWVAGTTSGTFSANGKSHQAVSQADTVLVKWSPTGSVLDVYGFTSAAGQINLPQDLEITMNDDILVGGVFLGSIDAGNQVSMTDSGNGDAYLIKFDKAGMASWGLSAGSSGGLERVYSIAEDSAGNFYVGGMISANTAFGSNYINSNGGLDLYMAKVDSQGSWEWVENLGSSADDLFADIAVNMSDFPAVIGSYQSTINKGSSSISSSGGLDLVIWAVDPENNADRDNDGVNDMTDNCPDTNNPLQIDSDLDGQGDECDYDDDNDGITDNSGDDCPRGGAWNWTSDSTTDFDNDGCKDATEDMDDDNDGVEDTNDSCLTSYTPPRDWWTSNPSNDVDGDGCRDSDEDNDDDGDGYEDAEDDCYKVEGYSNLGGYTGCVDSDSDGYADLEDTCPNQAGNSTLGGSLGCPDTDGDGWADTDDDLPNDPTQWDDLDGDGYGDNQAGNSPDACPSIPGTSVLDRFGCPDQDSDGYSSGDDDWNVGDGADAFPLDGTQWSDWDEDGFGDNYGNTTWSDRSENWPGEFYQYARDQDACPTLPGNSWQEDILGCPDSDGDGWADFMDAFPIDPENHRDVDKDGVADGNDDCIDVSGNSTEDLLGCPDTDGDGWADPMDGSDVYPLDSTQWADSDGDWFGDNIQGTNPDSCPNEMGFSFEGGILGCPDSDLDGWADQIDAFPNLMSQWNDTDGDGFGDNPDGQDADKCPDVAGVAKEMGCEEVIEESSAFDNVLVVSGITLLVIVLIAVGAFFMLKGRGDNELALESSMPAMPDMSAQPAAMPAMPDMYAQQSGYSDMTTVSSGRDIYSQHQPVLMPSQPAAAPAAPTMYDVGTMRSDGNEWLEYPDASGAWYMRDPTSREWIRKI